MVVIGSVPDTPIWCHGARAMTALLKLPPRCLIIYVAASHGHSDLLVPAGDHMEVAETSQPQSPFLIRVSPIGQPVCWLLGAVGRVYLAYCPEAEREAILKRLRKSEVPADRLARDPRRFDRILAETRERG
jgi:DNA-binding IclR family transcriptional regulator